MNHHLRFVGPAALAAGVILSLTSCSSTKVEPLIANPKHEITYEILIFDKRNEESTEKGIAVIDAETAATIIQSFDAPPTFRGTIGGRLREKKTLSNKKKFVYPSAYDPPEYSKFTGGQSFPVTPAKPRDFVTTQTGTTVSLTGSRVGDETLKIRVQLDRKILMGFVNYGTPITADATDFFGRTVPIIITENRMEQPHFSAFKKDTTIILKEGQSLILTDPGVEAPKEKKFPFTDKRPAGFVALIRAVRR